MKIQPHHENKKRSIAHLSVRYRSFIIMLLLDIAFASLAYISARTIMFFRVPAPASFLRFEIALAIVFIITLISMLVFFDCYNSMWKYAGRVEMFKSFLAYASSFAIIMILKIVVAIGFEVEIWTPLIFLYLILSAIASVSMRFFSAIVNYIKHIRNFVDVKSAMAVKRTIVIGAGYTGTLAINRFVNNSNEGYFPVAVIDDDPEKQGKKIYGLLVEGGMDKIHEVVYKYKAQAIVIAIMSISKSQLKNIYSQCVQFNIPIKIMPPISNADELSNKTLTLRDIKIEELLGREEFKVRQDLIDSSVKDKVVLVTGGAGSIGSELCRQSLKFGCKHLVIFDMHENGMFELNEEFKGIYNESSYSLVVGTVREQKKLYETFEKYKPDIVFHAAAYKHVPMMEISATEAIKNNVFGTLNVINQCVESKVDKFIFISTDKAVNPANIMGASKRIAEILIQNIGQKNRLKMAAVRFGNVLGSNGSVVPTFLKQIKEGGPVTVTDRNIKRYFMTIPEAVRLVLQTGALAQSGEVFVLDMGEPVHIYDLACDLIRTNGYIPEKDIKIVFSGLRQGEKLFEELRYDKESVDKTIHEGIFVNKLSKVNSDKFEKQLEILYRFASAEDEENTIKTIFEIVPSAYRNMAANEQIKTSGFTSQGVRPALEASELADEHI